MTTDVAATRPTRVYCWVRQLGPLHWCYFWGGLAFPNNDTVRLVARRALRLYDANPQSIGSKHTQSQRFLNPDWQGLHPDRDSAWDRPLRNLMELLATGESSLSELLESSDDSAEKTNFRYWISSFRFATCINGLTWVALISACISITLPMLKLHLARNQIVFIRWLLSNRSNIVCQCQCHCQSVQVLVTCHLWLTCHCANLSHLGEGGRKKRWRTAQRHEWRPEAGAGSIHWVFEFGTTVWFTERVGCNTTRVLESNYEISTGGGNQERVSHRCHVSRKKNQHQCQVMQANIRFKLIRIQIAKNMFKFISRAGIPSFLKSSSLVFSEHCCVQFFIMARTARAITANDQWLGLCLVYTLLLSNTCLSLTFRRLRSWSTETMFQWNTLTEKDWHLKWPRKVCMMSTNYNKNNKHQATMLVDWATNKLLRQPRTWCPNCWWNISWKLLASNFKMKSGDGGVGF